MQQLPPGAAREHEQVAVAQAQPLDDGDVAGGGSSGGGGGVGVGQDSVVGAVPDAVGAWRERGLGAQLELGGAAQAEDEAGGAVRLRGWGCVRVKVRARVRAGVRAGVRVRVRVRVGFGSGWAWVARGVGSSELSRGWGQLGRSPPGRDAMGSPPAHLVSVGLG